MTIPCANCGAENPAGMKFCGQCASPLANICTVCGFENPASFKFCGNCGQSVLHAQSPQAASEAEMLRRLQSYIPLDLADGSGELNDLSKPLDERDERGLGDGFAVG